MAITLAQAAVANEAESSNPTATFGSACTSGTRLVCIAKYVGGATTAINGVSDPTNGSWTLDATGDDNGDVGYHIKIFSVANTATTALTVTLALAAFDNGALTIFELTGSSAIVFDASGTDASGFSTTNPSCTVSTVANACILAGIAFTAADWSVAAGTNFTLVQSQAAGSGRHADERWLDVGSAGSKTVGFTLTSGGAGPYGVMSAASYKESGGGAGPSSFSKPLWPMSYF